MTAQARAWPAAWRTSGAERCDRPLGSCGGHAPRADIHAAGRSITSGDDAHRPRRDSADGVAPRLVSRRADELVMSAQAVEKPVDASAVTCSREPASSGYDGGVPKGVPMMASRDEIRALLAVPCDWCRAGVGERCSTTGQRKEATEGPRRSDRRPIRTLDGGCHDARWKRALGREAPVRVEAVAELRGVVEEPERQLVGAGAPVPVERPW